jgi:peptidoglycan/xylan/chitin deacetylase (PgdA/CDA1 family)
MNSQPLTILLYHGVTTQKQNGIKNYSNKHIKISEFIRQMDYVHKNFNVISMDEVVYLRSNNIGWPKNTVVITFDDGFRNNYQNAAPILSEYGLPATFYVCSGMINTTLMFWVDVIEACIDRTEKKEIKLTLSEPNIYCLRSKRNKIKTTQEIKAFCKNNSAIVKDQLISNLILETDVAPSTDYSEDYCMMTWKQLFELKQHELFTIGGHTLYHDIMSAQNCQKLEMDICGTINLLDLNLDQKNNSFFIPRGSEKPLQCFGYSDA